MSIEGGPILFNTTFSNDPNLNQAYPDQYPGGDHPAWTGAVTFNTGRPASLHFFSDVTGPYSESTLQLHFDGYQTQPRGVEHWSIDNVQVVLVLNGDSDGSGCVDDVDLAKELTAFGLTGENLPEDINRDLVVDNNDLSIAVSTFGEGCQG